MHVAVTNNREQIIRLLLAQKPELIDIVDKDGRTVLRVAVEKGHEQMIRLLLAQKPGLIDIVDKDGWTVLHMAAAKGDELVVQLLLAQKPELIDLMDKEGLTILQSSVKEGCSEVVEFLISIGATINSNPYYDRRVYINQMIKVGIVTDKILQGFPITDELQPLLNDNNKLMVIFLNRLKYGWIKQAKSGEQTLEKCYESFTSYNKTYIPKDLVLQIINPEKTGIIDRLKDGVIKIKEVAKFANTQLSENLISFERSILLLTANYYSTFEFSKRWISKV